MADDAAIPSCRSRKPARRTPSPSGPISAIASASPPTGLLTYRTSSDSAPLQSRGDRLRFLRILTETLFGSLKVERLHGMTFETRRQAKDEVIDWLAFYNAVSYYPTRLCH